MRSMLIAGFVAALIATPSFAQNQCTASGCGSKAGAAKTSSCGCGMMGGGMMGGMDHSKMDPFMDHSKMDQSNMDQSKMAQSTMDHSKMGHGSAPPANATASTKAYMEANDKMHKDMAITFSGDADIDFIKGMIPHHQGAIDMAKVVLAHGKDAETKKLAQEIIAAQEKEIAMMKDWLKKRGQ